MTNHALVERRGTELFVRDLVCHLRRRGWQPMVYSPRLGEVAHEIAALGVPVVSDLERLPDVPALIHGQHHLPAMAAMLRFPDVPALFVCHGWTPWEERPPRFPSIRRYVAVDDLCRERVEAAGQAAGVPVLTIYNAVDLDRFRPRAPLPARPARALIFSNYATDANFAAVLREACRLAGITRVDVVGYGVGAQTATPERVLPQYDLVFAKARCALEALAVGNAVIVADAPGAAGLVTRERAAAWRPLNFGFRTLDPDRLDVDFIRGEIGRYDADESAAVSGWIRGTADESLAWDQYERVYREVLEERSSWTADTARAACSLTAAYVMQLESDLRAQTAAFSTREASYVATEAARRQDLEAALAGSERTLADIRRRLSDIETSRTWQAMAPYRRLRRWLRFPSGLFG